MYNVKVCKVCGDEKPFEDFRKSNTKSGIGTTCRECYNLEHSEYKKQFKEKTKVYHKKYYEENKESLAIQQKRHREEYVKIHGRTFTSSRKEYNKFYYEAHKKKKEDN